MVTLSICFIVQTCSVRFVVSETLSLSLDDRKNTASEHLLLCGNLLHHSLMQIFHHILWAESLTAVWPLDKSIQLMFLAAAADAADVLRQQQAANV